MPTTKEGSGQPTVLYSVRQEFSQILAILVGNKPLIIFIIKISIFITILSQLIRPFLRSRFGSVSYPEDNDVLRATSRIGAGI